MAKQVRTKKFRYGIKHGRGFGPGCQPMDATFLLMESDPAGKYEGILTYSRRLTEDEISQYELTDLNKKPKKRFTVIREERNIKQSEMAEMLGVSVRTIQGWELNGMNKMPLYSAVKVAKVLGINVEELLDKEGDDD